MFVWLNYVTEHAVLEVMLYRNSLCVGICVSMKVHKNVSIPSSNELFRYCIFTHIGSTGYWVAIDFKRFWLLVASQLSFFWRLHHCSCNVYIAHVYLPSLPLCVPYNLNILLSILAWIVPIPFNSSQVKNMPCVYTSIAFSIRGVASLNNRQECKFKYRD